MIRILKLSEMKNLPLDAIVEAYRNGYRLETAEPGQIEQLGQEPRITTLATCPTTSKTVGSSTTISSTPSGGTPPYTVNILKDGTILKQFLGVTSGQTVSQTYTFVSADAGTTHVFSTTAYDSCPGAPKQSNVDQCSVSVVQPCPALGTPTITCPASITQGQVATFSASWTGGVAPYTVTFWEANAATSFAQVSNITTTSASATASGTTTQSWSVGTHGFYVMLYDSCAQGIQGTISTQCSTGVLSSCTTPTISITMT